MANPDPALASGWAIVVHGGAGVLAREAMTPATEARLREGLAAALEAGAVVLRDGGEALGAVEAAVRSLEDDPEFNAGRGAVFTAEGTNELDAAIMDGRTRQAGAVAGVTATKNPVTLARAVMDHSDHVLLAGQGADAFSRAQGLPQATPDYFRTEDRWRAFEESQAQGGFDRTLKYGTVGAVARDAHGHLAAATSTGGITGKRYGRVGDTPIPGAGTYADDRTCAVSATGSGEELLRLGIAHEIAARVRHLHETPLAAAHYVATTELTEIGGSGGVIVIGPRGEGGWAFNAPGMYRARVAQGGEAQFAIYEDGTEP